MIAAGRRVPIRGQCLCAALILGAIVPSLTAIQQTGARLAGTVMTSDSPPKPLRRAIVTLGGAGVNGRSAITDDQGRFAFVGLPDGRFSLTATKPGFIANAYGARQAGRPGTLVSVSAGQAATDLTIVLQRGAAISGTVHDHMGEPASGVRMFALRADAASPSPAPPRTEEFLTDDRGAYRIYGLTAGSYLVAAAPDDFARGEITIRSSAEIDELMRQQAQQSRFSAPQASATAPAQTTAATTAGSASAQPKRQPYVYAPIFFPGTPNGSAAERLTIAAGEDRDGIDLTLDLVPVGTIQGAAINPSGVVPELTMTISSGSPSLPGVYGAGPQLSGRPGSRDDPSFTFVNVPPGHYTIKAQTSNRRTIYQADGFRTEVLPPGTVPALWGLLDIDVGPQGLGGVMLTLQPAMTFSGRVAFDASVLKPPDDLTALRVVLSTASNGATPMLLNGVLQSGGPQTASAAVHADGTFEVSGLMPGRYGITSGVPGASGPAGWWLRSVDVGGRDALDAPFDLGANGSVSGTVLTFSDRHADLSGTLQAPAGQAATEYYIIAFPSDKTLWRAGSRRIRALRPASDGHFDFAEIPPGDYILSALTDVTTDEWENPAFLAQLAAAGTRITVAPGEKKVQSLKISR